MYKISTAEHVTDNEKISDKAMLRMIQSNRCYRFVSIS